MRRPENAFFGIPPMLYRSPSQIKRDIREIKERIEEINERTNIRSLLFDMLVDSKEESPQLVVKALSEALTEAEEALGKLRTLEEELSDLECELTEVKCELGI